MLRSDTAQNSLSDRVRVLLSRGISRRLRNQMSGSGAFALGGPVFSLKSRRVGGMLASS
jgi:hypothetical protein